MKKSWIAAPAFAAAFVLAGAALAEDPAKPPPQEGPTVETIARNCTGCHGADGKSPGSVPTIAGKSADWIAGRLMQFRSGERPSSIMGRIIKPFADEDIRNIADYFAAKK
jgi:sulfide dehydrogenase cytochrome subunit